MSVLAEYSLCLAESAYCIILYNALFNINAGGEILRILAGNDCIHIGGVIAVFVKIKR